MTLTDVKKTFGSDVELVKYDRKRHRRYVHSIMMRYINDPSVDHDQLDIKLYNFPGTLAVLGNCILGFSFGISNTVLFTYVRANLRGGGLGTFLMKHNLAPVVPRLYVYRGPKREFVAKHGLKSFYDA